MRQLFLYLFISPYTKRLVAFIFKKNLKRTIKKIERMCGCTWGVIMNTFSLATLSFIFIKILLYGFYFYWPPVINFMVLLVLVVTYLKYNVVMIFRFRILARALYFLLGSKYVKLYNPLDKNLVYIDGKCNKVFQFFFTLLIFLRISILKNPLIFLILSIILTTFILLNNYNLLSLIISLIMQLSRQILLISDWTMKDYMTTLRKSVLIFTDNELKVNWQFARLVGFWSIRYIGFYWFVDFSVQEFFSPGVQVMFLMCEIEEKEQVYLQAKMVEYQILL